MPLISCPDCHRDISDAAPTCPNCGRPMKRETDTQPNCTEVREQGIFMQTMNVGCGLILFVIALALYPDRETEIIVFVAIMLAVKVAQHVTRARKQARLRGAEVPTLEEYGEALGKHLKPLAVVLERMNNIGRNRDKKDLSNKVVAIILVALVALFIGLILLAEWSTG